MTYSDDYSNSDWEREADEADARIDGGDDYDPDTDWDAEDDLTPADLDWGV